jgi:hypothetical protein
MFAEKSFMLILLFRDLRGFFGRANTLVWVFMDVGESGGRSSRSTHGRSCLLLLVLDASYMAGLARFWMFTGWRQWGASNFTGKFLAYAGGRSLKALERWEPFRSCGVTTGTMAY